MSTALPQFRQTTLPTTHTLVAMLIGLLAFSSMANFANTASAARQQQANLQTASHIETMPEKKPVLHFTDEMIARLTSLSKSRSEETREMNKDASQTQVPIHRVAKKPRHQVSRKDPVAQKEERAPVEVLVVPQANNENNLDAPKSKSRDCYQAPALTSLSANITLPGGKMPTNAAAVCAEQNNPASDMRLCGNWGNSELHWSATCSKHLPLYFEEINAERYGYTPSAMFQPVISAAHFFATIPALPYKMAVEHPRECIYTLGHYRPGSCVPRRHNRIPKKLSASAVQAGFVAGLILLVP